MGARRPLGPVARRQHRRRGRAAQRRAEGGRQRQDGQGRGLRRAGHRLRRRRARHPQGFRGRTRGRTSTSPRTNGSANSPSPATPWTWRSSSRPIRGPSPTSSRCCGNSTKVPGQDLRHPAGFRDPHVLLQQGHAAQDRQGRSLHRGPAGAGREGRVHDGRPLEPRQGGGRQGRGPDRHHAPAQCRSRLPDDIRRPSARSSSIRHRASCCCPRRRSGTGSNGSRWNAENGVTPKNNTAMSWDEIQGAFKTEKAFIYHQGVWAVEGMDARRRQGRHLAQRRRWYFNKIGWMHAPAAEKGGQPTNLSHPIVYIVNPKSKNARSRGDAGRLCHPALLQHQARRDDGAHRHRQRPEEHAGLLDAWYLDAATPMLARSTFIPNHPDFGRYNGILFKALQGVETGRLTPARPSSSSRTR